MTPEQINTVIAEWCGWKVWKDDGAWAIKSPDGRVWYAFDRNQDLQHMGVDWPNFYGDRNAFHAAYSRLTNSQKHAYLDNLLAIIDRRPVVYVLDAELPECCEALLRTIGRWEIERTK